MTKILEIQGLRALAVILVITYHADFIPGGFIGVDIFYVISGFLITNLIIKEITNQGTLNLVNFYYHRIKRLLPASALVLSITALSCYLLLPPLDRYQIGKDVIAVSLLLSNYAFAIWENDYQNLGEAASPFIHYWSLAVEEQFYLIWPLFILAFAKFGMKAVKTAIFAVFVISLLFSITQTPTSPIFSFYSLHTRAWELAAGALLVFLPKNQLGVGKAFNKFFAITGALLIIASAYLLTPESSFPGYLVILPVLGSFLLIASITDWPGLFKKVLNSKLIQHIGAISYSLYLWHWPVLVVPALVLERPIGLNEKLIAIAATVLLAHLTYQFVEQPFRYAKLSLSKTFSTLAAATTCLILLGSVILNTHSANISVKEQNFSLELTEVTSLPIIHSDGCHVNWDREISTDCTYGDLTSNKTMVLFGDSHAAQWFDAVEAIAKRQGFRLISLTKSACSALKLPISNRGSYNNSECRKWQNNSIERIKELKPEILIVSAFSHYKLNSTQKSRDFYYLDAQKNLSQELADSVDHLVYLTDTPKPVKNIPRCLSNNSLEVCNEINRSSNLVYEDFIKIDPYKWFCDKSCTATKDNYIVYRDASHISRAAAKAATAQLEDALIKNKIFN